MADAVRMKRFLNITATFAHQLNNDLAAILGYAEILTDDANADEAVNTYAMEILVGGRSVRSTVERFHMLHHLASAEVFPFDARQVLERTRNALLSRLGPSLRLAADTSQSQISNQQSMRPLRTICGPEKSAVS
jgi:signal transduction histidine kinase